MSQSLKKWVFGSSGWTKHNIDFQYPQGVYFLEKWYELSEAVGFGQKLRYFTDQKESKKCIFWEFRANLSKKSKSTKAIYIYPSERSRYILSENGIVHYAMTYCFRDFFESKNFVKLLLSQHLF